MHQAPSFPPHGGPRESRIAPDVSDGRTRWALPFHTFKPAEQGTTGTFVYMEFRAV